MVKALIRALAGSVWRGEPELEFPRHGPEGWWYVGQLSRCRCLLSSHLKTGKPAAGVRQCNERVPLRC